MSEYKGNNIFEKLGALIPGYRGYSERDGRRDTDKILRNYIARSLAQNSDGLNKIAKDLFKKNQLEKVSQIDEIKRKLTIINDLIRFSEHGGAGFFDTIQVDESMLDQLYLHDIKIKEKADEIRKLFEQTLLQENISEKLSFIEVQLDELKQLVSERDNIVKGID